MDVLCCVGKTKIQAAEWGRPKTTFKNCVKFAEFNIRKIGLRPQAHFRQSQKLFGRDRQIFVVVAVVAFKGDDEDTVK